MKIEGAVGATVEIGDNNEPYIVVLTKDDPTTATVNSAPTQIDGFPVEVEKMEGWRRSRGYTNTNSTRSDGEGESWV
jgi:hypothetical protein